MPNTHENHWVGGAGRSTISWSNTAVVDEAAGPPRDRTGINVRERLVASMRSGTTWRRSPTWRRITHEINNRSTRSCS
jgi:hypothetical protein